MYIENLKLKQTDKFSYLEVLFDEENGQSLEISNRIQTYSGNVSALYPIPKNNNVTLKAKTTIFTTILRSILIYGSETTTLTTKTSLQIQETEMRVLRIILGVTRLNRMRNKVIRERLNVASVVKNKIRWFCHVKKIKASKCAKISQEWVRVQRGRRPAGRHRKRWMESVREAAEKRKTN